MSGLWKVSVHRENAAGEWAQFFLRLHLCKPSWRHKIVHKEEPFTLSLISNGRYLTHSQLSLLKEVSPRKKDWNVSPPMQMQKKKKSWYRCGIWNNKRSLVYANISRLWMYTSWIPTNSCIVMRSLADLSVFELLTVTVYYLTLKEYRSARNPSCHHYNWWLCKLSQVEFLTSFIKTFMIKHLPTNHTSDLHFTKISTFTTLNNLGLVRIVCQNGWRNRRKTLVYHSSANKTWDL